MSKSIKSEYDAALKLAPAYKPIRAYGVEAWYEWQHRKHWFTRSGTRTYLVPWRMQHG